MMATVLIQKKRVRWTDDGYNPMIHGRYVPQYEVETDWQIFVYRVKKFLRMNIDDDL